MAKTVNIRLVPCKCGSDDIQFGGMRGLYYAKCRKCGRTGGVHNSRKSVAASWNRLMLEQEKEDK